MRTVLAAYFNNRLCCKYKSDDKNSYELALKVKKLASVERQEKARAIEKDPSLKTEPETRMKGYRTMAVKPTVIINKPCVDEGRRATSPQ